METTTPPASHIGKKISRIRELRGMKQESLALELGLSQQMVSKIESSEEVEAELLDKIAKALGLSAEAVRNFSEEAIFNIIGNTYHDNSASLNYQCSFNPIDKIVALYDEKVELLQRLLQSEREKNEILKGK
ncbi:MAG: helix-turn-helix domain-containing protein [Daejeonella sp.]